MGDVIALATHPAREHRVTVRLSAEEADQLNRYASRHGVATSNVIRLATSKFLAAEERERSGEALADAVRAAMNIGSSILSPGA